MLFDVNDPHYFGQWTVPRPDPGWDITTPLNEARAQNDQLKKMSLDVWNMLSPARWQEIEDQRTANYDPIDTLRRLFQRQADESSLRWEAAGDRIPNSRPGEHPRSFAGGMEGWGGQRTQGPWSPPQSNQAVRESKSRFTGGPLPFMTRTLETLQEMLQRQRLRELMGMQGTTAAVPWVPEVPDDVDQVRARRDYNRKQWNLWGLPG